MLELNRMWQIISYFYFAISAILFGVVLLRPKFFWPALFFAAVFEAGLMANGYTFFDEISIGAILLAGFIAVMAGAVHFYGRKERGRDILHQFFFYLFAAYMMLESVRGLFILSSPEKIRWVLFFAMIGMIGFLAAKKNFPVLEPKKLALLISGSLSVYLVYYLGYGFFTEIFRKLSRFSIQPGEWPTPAYALFPLVVGIPCAFLLIQDQDKKSFYRWIGWVFLILAVLAGIYYNARMAILTATVCFFVYLPRIGTKKILFLAASFLIAGSIFFLVGDKEKLIQANMDFFEDSCKSVQNLFHWTDSSKDIDRKVHFEVGFTSIERNLSTILFGYGFRMHGYVIGPYLRASFIEKGSPGLASIVTDNESTEGFTALLVDTGAVGVILLSMNFLLVAYKIIIQNGNPHKLLILLVLAFAFFWLPIINMLDAVFFYLLIMPNGLLLQLSRYPLKTGFA